MAVGIKVINEADPHPANELGEIENLLGCIRQRTGSILISQAQSVVKYVADLSEMWRSVIFWT